VLDAFRASPRLHGFPVQVGDLFEVEERSVSIRQIPAHGKSREFHLPGAVGSGYGTVGSAEIDPDIHF
jgi:hypothetical protein